jgi:hypothetical protein
LIPPVSLVTVPPLPVTETDNACVTPGSCAISRAMLARAMPMFQTPRRNIVAVSVRTN